MRFTELLIMLTLAVPILAHATEKAVYVGEGRYYGQERDSVDSAILNQRNHEQTLLQQERNRNEERYERAERREREYQRERYEDRD